MPRLPYEQVARVARSPLVLTAGAALVFGAAAWLILFGPPLGPSPAGGAPARPSYRLELSLTRPDMEPWGVAGDDLGRILVCDRAQNDLLLFERTGALVTTARRQRPDVKDLLLEPTGVCFDPSSRRIFVCDTGHDRVALFDRDLRFLSSFGGRGSEPGRFARPVGVAADGAGKIHVVQVDDARLQTFDADGRFQDLATPERLKMTHLWDVACLPGGGFALSSALGGLTLYDADLTPVRSLAERGLGPGCYLFTTGLGVDPAGRLYACAKTQGKVMVFAQPTEGAPRGTLLAELQSTEGPAFDAPPKPLLATHSTTEAGTAVRSFMDRSILYPMDVAFLAPDTLLVAERGNRRVLVFREVPGGGGAR